MKMVNYIYYLFQSFIKKSLDLSIIKNVHGVKPNHQVHYSAVQYAVYIIVKIADITPYQEFVTDVHCFNQEVMNQVDHQFSKEGVVKLFILILDNNNYY